MELGYELDDVVWRYLYFGFALFLLAEFKEFGDESFKVDAVLVYREYLVIYRWGEFRV